MTFTLFTKPWPGKSLQELAGFVKNLGFDGVELGAAAVDREPLGNGAEIAAGNITRHEKSLAARQAFDEWASRFRTFLDRAHELKGEDSRRADESYQPYGAAPAAK